MVENTYRAARRTWARRCFQCLPGPLREPLRHMVARRLFRRFMAQKLGSITHPPPGPAGSRQIILRTAVLSQEDIPSRTDPNWYFASAYFHLLRWLRILDRHAIELHRIRDILELGCGSARLIRHLRCMPGVRLVGTDVSAMHVQWCRTHLRDIDFHVNDALPPLAFAPDRSFDLVMAASVFTHIRVDDWPAWAAELRRVLRPGGILLADVLGKFHAQRQLSRQERDDLARLGRFTLEPDHPRVSLSSRLSELPDVFCAHPESFRIFLSQFRVLEYTQDELDLFVLRREDPS